MGKSSEETGLRVRENEDVIFLGEVFRRNSKIWMWEKEDVIFYGKIFSRNGKIWVWENEDVFQMSDGENILSFDLIQDCAGWRGVSQSIWNC